MPAVASEAVGVSSATRCQVCASKIVVPGVDDVMVKNAILRVHRSSGEVHAKCPRCKAWVRVPLRYLE